MEEKKEPLFKEQGNLNVEKKISRKEAIKKTGLIAASTTTMMILMKSQKAQATSGDFSHQNDQGEDNDNQ